MKNLVRKLRKQEKLFIGIFLLLFLFSPPTNSQTLKQSDDSSAIFSTEYSQIFLEAEKLQKEGEFEKAIEEFNKSREIAKKLSDKEKECRSLIKLGLLYWNVGKLKLSSQYYSDALAIAKESRLKKLEEKCQNSLKIYLLYNQGKKFRSSGDTKKSIESFENAINLSRIIKSQEHEQKCLRVLSSVYWKLNDFQRFYVLNKEALKIAQIFIISILLLASSASWSFMMPGLPRRVSSSSWVGI